MSNIAVQLEKHLATQATPYLFVGAGFSRRYANLPSWRDLLEHFASFTDMPFGYYDTGGLPNAASRLAANFREVWWKDDRFADSRAKWGKQLGDDESSALKIEIANYLDGLLDSTPIDPTLKLEFDLLKSATIDGIITTNYDKLLSKVFPTYTTFEGQEGLLFSDTQGIAEIYAIHGSTSNPLSLLLTQEDYDKFKSRNQYVAAKLMTIFVEHPVIFLGYSLADPNIQDILLSLIGGLQDKAYEKLQDRLIFIEWDPDSDGDFSRTQMSIEGEFLPVVKITVPDWHDVFKVLNYREHALPARTLRILKKQVYDIILTNDPKKRLYAYKHIDDENADDISIVFGVGAIASVGYTGLTRRDLVLDLIEPPKSPLDAEKVLDSVIAPIRFNWNTPCFKYLSEANLLDDDGRLITGHGRPASIEARVKHIEKRIVLEREHVTRMSISELKAAIGVDGILKQGYRLPSRTHDLEGLRELLIPLLSATEETNKMSTEVARMAVTYDYMKYSLRL